MTFAQLYADMLTAANAKAQPPEGTFTVQQYAVDAGRSTSWAAADLLRKVQAGELGRDKFGNKYYYWFRAQKVQNEE